MVNGFERETHELTDYELTMIEPMLKGLETKIGEENSITNKFINEGMKKAGFKTNPARIRKLINYIRVNGLIKNLISSSNGYWIEKDPGRIEIYIESLMQRSREIQRVAESFKK